MSGLVSYGMGSSDESSGSDSEDNSVKTSFEKTVPQNIQESGVQGKKTSLFASLPKPKSSAGQTTPDTGSSAAANIHSTNAILPGSSSFHGSGDAPKKTSLFSNLPPPKKPTISVNEKTQSTGTGLPGSGVSKGFLNLPPPKKKQPVKITLPALPDPDSDEDEPEEKKPKSMKGAGLFSVLPKPRTASRKEANRLLIPHTLTKKPSPAPALPAKPPAPTQPSKTSVSQTTAKQHQSGANPLVSGYSDDDEEEEERQKGSSTQGQVNFFSMEDYNQEENVPQGLDMGPSPQLSNAGGGGSRSALQSGQVSQSDSSVARTSADFPEEIGPPAVPPVQDQPLVFNPTRVQSSIYPTSQTYHYGTSNSQYPGSSYGSEAMNSAYETTGATEYYNQTAPVGGDSSQGGSSSQQTFLQDEGFSRMVGKKNRGKEEIQIIDINADDQIGPTSGLQQMVKSMTEEKESRTKLKKEQLPTSQQKRKHQITYLARQAKERELELKNQWADNRMTRKQTQAKYGF